jgi:hypothetical protein
MVGVPEDDEDMKVQEEEAMMIDTSSEIFRLADISEAIKNCNFNKGLGPDCFDGNILHSDQSLCDKVSYEILDALNQGNIPEYLKIGRMVPL